MASSRRRKKKHGGSAENTVELNLMPFIDVFSLLTTFLLFSAVFLAIGILEVQIPFLSSTPPPETAPERSLEVKVDVEKNKIIMTTSYSSPPREEKDTEFTRNPEGIAELHAKLIGVRVQNPKLDLLTFFVEDDVTYAEMTEVLDAIKLRNEGDPDIPLPENVSERDAALMQSFLFPKVIMGSVMLQ